MSAGEAMADDARRHGAQILLGHEVCEMTTAGDRITAVVVRSTGNDERRSLPCSHLASTIPLTVLADQLQVPWRRAPHATPRFRLTVLVDLLVRGDHIFPDHSIYVNNPLVAVGRGHEFLELGVAMHQGRGHTVLCAELWCNRHDATWATDDGALVKQIVRELHHIGLLAGQAIEEHRAIRVTTSPGSSTSTPPAAPSHSSTATWIAVVMMGSAVAHALDEQTDRRVAVGCTTARPRGALALNVGWRTEASTKALGR